MKSRWTYALAAALAATLHVTNGLAQSVPLADGEIRKIDKDAGKLTIKHGPIPSMDMPPMTMVYRVADPAMLGEVKTGDKIRFDAKKEAGQYVVTKLEPVK